MLPLPLILATSATVLIGHLPFVRLVLRGGSFRAIVGVGAGVVVAFIASGGFLYAALASSTLRNYVVALGSAGRWALVLLAVITGVLLFTLKLRAIALYAVVELGFAAMMVYDATSIPRGVLTLEFFGKTAAAIYLIVSSLDNFAKAVAKAIDDVKRLVETEAKDLAAGLETIRALMSFTQPHGPRSTL